MNGDDERRERRSWREIDRQRDGARSSEERRPRSAAERERASAATKQYLKQVDGMFSPGKGGSEAASLAKAMRAAHGTPGLAAACRAYREALGVPQDTALLSLFLDCGDPELVVAGLESLSALAETGDLELSRGQRSQLRVLAQDANDDIAGAAEDLIERDG